MKIDGSLDDVQKTRFYNIYHNIIKKLLKQAPFSEVELTSILVVYYKYCLTRGEKTKHMSQVQFNSFFELVFNIHDIFIVERIMMTLGNRQRNYITAEEWVNMFKIYLRSTLEEKMQFCFAVYNLDETDVLTREVLQKLIRMSGEDEEESELLADELVDIAIKRMDIDRDGKISYEDYTTAVRRSPALMEFLGQCIPNKDGIVQAAICCNLDSVLRQQGL